jgi:hypothetical protein
LEALSDSSHIKNHHEDKFTPSPQNSPACFSYEPKESLPKSGSGKLSNTCTKKITRKSKHTKKLHPYILLQPSINIAKPYFICSITILQRYFKTTDFLSDRMIIFIINSILQQIM